MSYLRFYMLSFMPLSYISVLCGDAVVFSFRSSVVWSVLADSSIYDCLGERVVVCVAVVFKFYWDSWVEMEIYCPYWINF